MHAHENRHHARGSSKSWHGKSWELGKLQASHGLESESARASAHDAASPSPPDSKLTMLLATSHTAPLVNLSGGDVGGGAGAE